MNHFLPPEGLTVVNRHTSCLAVAVLLGWAPWAMGNDVTTERSAAPAFSLGGTLVGGAWSTTRQLDDDPSALNAALRIQGQFQLSDVLSAKLDGVLGIDDSRSQSNTLHQSREGYIQRKTENSEFRFGRQLIAWGRADKLNPTDYFASRDYTFLTSDDEEQKNGVDALRAVMHLGEYDLQGVVAHGNAKNTWPFHIANNVDFNQSKEQFGVKLDRYGEGFDWSVSFYRGMDRNPNLAPNLATGGIASRYDDVSALGLDFAAASGALTYRGEAAYFRTSDSAGQNPYRRNNHLDFVLGMDGSPFRNANLGIQYYGVAVSHYSSDVLFDPIARAGALLGNQLRSFQQGVTVRFAQNWLNDALQFEIRANYGLTDHGKYIFPKLIYKPNDYWSVAVGGEYFKGDSNSYFGQLKKNSGVFTEARFAW